MSTQDPENFLDLCKRLRFEVKKSGTGPADVVGQSGENFEIVQYIVEAWGQVQNMRPNWDFHHVRDVSVNTVAATRDYTIATHWILSNWRSWDLSSKNGQSYERPFRIYRQSDGQKYERWIPCLPYAYWRDIYGAGVYDNGPPTMLTLLPDGTVRLHPTPDDIYVVTGDYWMANHVMIDKADKPLIQKQHILVIVYQALLNYATREEVPEVMANASIGVRSTSQVLEQINLPKMSFGYDAVDA